MLSCGETTLRLLLEGMIWKRMEIIFKAVSKNGWSDFSALLTVWRKILSRKLYIVGLQTTFLAQDLINLPGLRSLLKTLWPV